MAATPSANRNKNSITSAKIMQPITKAIISMIFIVLVYLKVELK